MGLFGDKEAVFRFSHLRLVYFLIAVAAFGLTELGRYVYRPYVYRSGINDIGIADSMGNSLGVITQIFFSLMILHSNWRQGRRVIVFIVCGYIVYEFLQPVLPKGTYDTKDVIATVVGGVLALGVLWLAKRVAGDRVLSGTTTADPTPESETR